MNIFILSENPVEAAKNHCDKHVVKMILETAQMMCTVLNEQGIKTSYKTTHKNHPCTVWLRESIHNWNWLKALAYNLNEEYKRRFNHPHHNHKSYDVIQNLPTPVLNDIEMTPFAQAMPDKYRNEDAVKAYREYYMNDKWDILYYKDTPVPVWIPKEWF